MVQKYKEMQDEVRSVIIKKSKLFLFLSFFAVF